MKKSGAEMIVSFLEMNEIKTVFGIPGSSNLPLYDALSKSNIQHVLVGHEQAAGFMAQGFTRSTGKTAVCLATSGPGLTNLLTAIADSFLDSIPIVAITGQVPSHLIGSQAFQELDTERLTASITKKCFIVQEASALHQILPLAFSLAQSGRPGPVLIDIPKDVQNQQVEYQGFTNPYAIDFLKKRIDDKQIESAVSLINASKNPLLLIGGGLIEAHASEALTAFSEKFIFPIASTLRGLGAVDPNHPNYLGMIGMHGNKRLNEWSDDVDLLIALGVRFGDRTTGLVREFFPNAQVIHVNIDPLELNKTKQSHLPIAGDLHQFLRQMINQPIEKKAIAFNNQKAANTASVDSSSHKVSNASPTNALTSSSLSSAAHSPRSILECIAQMVPSDTIVTTDVGQHQMWVAQYYPFSKPRTFITSAGLGTMGFGLPAAIGASIAFPDKKIVCITGDGSFLMNIQELATLRKLQSNISIFIFNNQGLGLVRQQQRLFFENNLYASDFGAAIDFHVIAQGFGINAMRLDHTITMEKAIQQTLSQQGPCLLDLPIEKNWNVLPMVPPGAAIKTMIDEKSFEYGFDNVKQIR